MDLTDIKARVIEIEPLLARQPWVELETFSRDGRPLRLLLTDRLRKRCRKEGVWRSRELWATLKNAAHGFDPERARSASGRDGIFLLDRGHRPENEMMRKIFDGFLDKEGSGAPELAESMGSQPAELLPVRLVSHYLRLLGLLRRGETSDTLILVDCDRSE